MGVFFHPFIKCHLRSLHHRCLFYPYFKEEKYEHLCSPCHGVLLSGIKKKNMNVPNSLHKTTTTTLQICWLVSSAPCYKATLVQRLTPTHNPLCVNFLCIGFPQSLKERQISDFLQTRSKNVHAKNEKNLLGNN